MHALENATSDFSGMQLMGMRINTARVPNATRNKCLLMHQNAVHELCIMSGMHCF